MNNAYTANYTAYMHLCMCYVWKEHIEILAMDDEYVFGGK